jgi:plasmid stabilization system protein ParE
MIDRALLFEGTLYAVVAIRTRAGRSTLYDEFVGGLDPADQKKLDRAVARLADWGLPRNPEKGRALKGYSNLYEIKEHGLRVIWFATEERTESGRRVVVISHGFEIRRAERLKAEYIETFSE